MAARYTHKGSTPEKGAARLREMGARVKAATRAAMERLGPELVASIRAEMHAVQPGLHPFTVATTGRTQPLVGGALERAVSYRVETTGRGVSVWAGVPASAGGELTMIARVHEHGATIRVTPAMRGYLGAQGLHLRPETDAVVIPARPFVGPGVERVRSGGRARTVLVEHVAGALRR